MQVDQRRGDQPATAVELFADGSLTVDQAAAFTGLGKTFLYELMQGKLPYTQLGRRRLIPKRALVELLASGLVGGAAK